MSSTPEKMATPQQKLKMKMVAIDTWSVREQLCLASSVLRSGDQNWNSVSRSLKPFSEPNRPSDWLSPRNCALQYNTLLEKTGAHKRKRGERHPSTGSNDSQQGETAGEIILRQLTQDRIEELQQQLEASRKEYHQLQKELELVRSGKIDDQLQAICKKIDEEQERKLKEQSSHLKWLQERELKQQELRQAHQLLRSPSKTSLPHSESIESELASSSPSVTDQLNIDVTAEEVREVAATEAKATSSGNLTPVAPAATPSSPLLTSLLRSPTASTAGQSSAAATKLSFPLSSPSTMSPGLKNLVSNAIAEETSPTKAVSTSPASGAAAPTLTRLLELPLNSPGKPLPELTVGEETEVSTATSPLKSETPAEEEQPASASEEITPTAASEAVEGAAETEVKDLLKQSTDVAMETESETAVEPLEAADEEKIRAEEESIPKAEVVDEKGLVRDGNQTSELAMENEVEVSDEVAAINTEENVLEPKSVAKTEPCGEDEEPTREENEKEAEEENESGEDKPGEKEELKSPEAESRVSKSEAGTPKLGRRPLRAMRRKGARTETEEPREEKIKPAEAGPSKRRSSGRKAQQAEEQPEGETTGEQTDITSSSSHGKKKAPPPPPLYVPSPSPAPSSGVDSTPNSPTSSVSTVNEDDREYRIWKKSTLLLWREISSHKHASLFAKPISEEQVHGYRGVILRPMDLSTIKKNIESGAIRTTAEFQRDLALMFFNAIIYNPNHHEVNRLAREMFAETSNIIQEFMSAQMLAAHNIESSRPHRRETRDVARRTESWSSHEETPSKPEEGKTRAAKRASAVAHVEETTAKPKRRSRVAQND